MPQRQLEFKLRVRLRPGCARSTVHPVCSEVLFLKLNSPGSSSTLTEGAVDDGFSPNCRSTGTGSLDRPVLRSSSTIRVWCRKIHRRQGGSPRVCSDPSHRCARSCFQDRPRISEDARTAEPEADGYSRGGRLEP